MPTGIAKDHVALRIGTHIAELIGERKFSMWFGESASLNYDDKSHCLVVGAANRFVADWIKHNFQDTVRKAVCRELDDTAKVTVEVSDAPKNKIGSKISSNNNNLADSTIKPGNIASVKANIKTVHTQTKSLKNYTYRYSLEDFVVGKSNELAFAAADGLAHGEDSAVHPLFIHGDCGLGKTHLLQGICKQLSNHKNNAKVIYTTGERFTNEYITAIRSNKLNSFRRRMRKLDLLAVDDVHFIANKQATQQEFLHSFDEIELGGAKLVLASDSHPKWIKQFSKALVSRCMRGMVVKVDKPDIDTRSQLIQSLSRRKKLFIKDSIAKILASRCTGSVREIEGTLNQLVALCSLNFYSRTNSKEISQLNGCGHFEINRHIVDQLFSQQPAQRKKPVRFEDIVATVSKQTGISFEKITSRSRQRQVVTARSLTVYLARELTSMSYPEIAGAMGKKNHSSIIESVKRIKKQVEKGLTVEFFCQEEKITIYELIERTKAQILYSA